MAKSVAKSIQELAMEIKDEVNEKINAFDAGDGTSVEAFQDDLLAKLEEGGLLERDVYLQVDNIAPHPDNREKTMLTPYDCHGVLDLMLHNAFSYSKWDALACTVPPGDMGSEWLSKVDALQKGSGGLIPAFSLDRVGHFTARGSHGTSALRSAKLGGVGVNPDILDDDGNISKGKVLEKQSTLKAPFDKGVPYTIVPWQVCGACPRLMEILSRTGNSSHGAYRAATTLQHCNRVHNIVKHKKGDIDWEQVAKQACIAMGPDFGASAKLICEFVKLWSGGVDGRVLKDLEAYERTLTVKRSIYPADLGKLTNIDFVDCARYVPALIKAMLNSPTCDATEHSNLFVQLDFTSLQSTGKNRPYAVDACKWMKSAETFIHAYAKLDDVQNARLLSELQIRLVMHVHQKKCPSRTSFSSMSAIARAMYDAAKKIDPTLPVWSSLIKSEQANATQSALKKDKAASAMGAINSQAVSHASGLRELRVDDIVDASVLEAWGFVEGRRAVKTDDPEQCIWSIIECSVDDENVCLQKVARPMPPPPRTCLLVM
jgi:hypothetical protein